MTLGLVGRKVGMTRIFDENGSSVPVTVLDMSANRVSQLKSTEADGYSAVQIAYGVRKANRINKATAGHFAKAGIEAAEGLHEFRLTAEEMSSLKVADAVNVSLFQVGQRVDVTGTSKGKGFSGVIKRHNFSSNRASHGNSRSHNTPGSIGQAQDPGRIFPGKKMAGQYGNVKSTVQSLEIVRIDAERQLILVKGAVPGARDSNVIVSPAVKVGA